MLNFDCSGDQHEFLLRASTYCKDHTIDPFANLPPWLQTKYPSTPSSQTSDFFAQQKAHQEERERQKIEAEEQERQRIEAEERERLAKLKRLIKVSKKLPRADIGRYINLEGDALFERLVKWAEEYGFVLDGDFVDFEGGRKDDFIASLDTAFAAWDKKTETKDGKLE